MLILFPEKRFLSLTTFYYSIQCLSLQNVSNFSSQKVYCKGVVHSKRTSVSCLFYHDCNSCKLGVN